MDFKIVESGLIKPSEISVNLSYSFNRKSCPIVDNSIDSDWNAACEQNKHMFNASKFRLADIVNLNGRWVLSIGITDYKETFCTNLSSKCTEISQYGLQMHLDESACFGDAIGVGSVVISEDGFIVLIKRAAWVSEGQCLIDTPGGHAEPQELLSRLKTNDIFAVDSKDIIDEIFHSMIREVRDEINVPENSLTWPILLGLFRNNTLGGKPGFLFYMKCSLLSSDIEKLYFKGGPETDESTQILFVPAKELAETENFDSFIESMTPGGKAILHLYRQFYSQL